MAWLWTCRKPVFEPKMDHFIYPTLRNSETMNFNQLRFEKHCKYIYFIRQIWTLI